MTLARRLEQYPFATLAACCLLLFFFHLELLPVSIMEARNFVVSREMIVDGHWLLTTLNGVARYQKPPLPAWITTPFAHALGLDSATAYRLPTAMIASLGVFFFYLFVKKLALDRVLALWTALVLATSFYYLVIRFEAPSDMYTHAFMLGALYFWTRINASAKPWKFVLLGGLCFGLSVLAKGPVSPYALFLPFAVSYAAVYSDVFRRHWPRYIGLLVLGLLIGSSWYIYVKMADPEGMMEVARRETSNWHSYNVKPFYYYWSFFIQSGIWTVPAAVSLMFPYFRRRVPHRKLYALSWLWTVLAVVLLSAVPEKKPRYLLPALVPLAINVALVFRYLALAPRLSVFDKAYAHTHYAVVFLLCIASPAVWFLMGNSANGFLSWYIPFCLGAYAIAAYLVVQWWQGRYGGLFWSNVFLVVLVAAWGMGAIKYMQGNPEFDSLQTLGAGKDQKQAYYFPGLDPEIVWEFGRGSNPWNPEAAPTDTVPIVVLVPDRDSQTFEDALPREFHVLNEKTFDRNYFAPPGKSGYKARHKIKVYTLVRR